jgi:hypothetical protein
MAAKKVKYPFANDNVLHGKIVRFLETKIVAPCNTLARDILFIIDEDRRQKNLEGVRERAPNSRYVAVLEEDYHVLNRMGGALEGCRAELAIVIEHLNAAK